MSLSAKSSLSRYTCVTLRTKLHICYTLRLFACLVIAYTIQQNHVLVIHSFVSLFGGLEVNKNTLGIDVWFCGELLTNRTRLTTLII